MPVTVAGSTRSESFPTRRFAQTVPLTTFDRPELAGRHVELVELRRGHR